MKTFLFLFALVLSNIHAYEFQDFTENGVEYVWDRKELYEEGLGVYLAAFRTLYTELGVENRESHFRETMKHELELVEAHPNEIHWLLALKDEKVVGISIVELFTYPDLYVRELAVLPEYQMRGIGKALTFAPLKDLPDLRKISIVTRKINVPAITFYTVLGFTVSDFTHSGYDPNRYIGMEWQRMPSSCGDGN